MCDQSDPLCEEFHLCDESRLFRGGARRSPSRRISLSSTSCDRKTLRHAGAGVSGRDGNGLCGEYVRDNRMHRGGERRAGRLRGRSRQYLHCNSGKTCQAQVVGQEPPATRFGGGRQMQRICGPEGVLPLPSAIVSSRSFYYAAPSATAPTRFASCRARCPSRS